MITFYYGSGSPFAWRVWLALEHKALPYEMKLLSFSAGDTRKPEFLALNPRHKVPVIVDDGFALYESAVIVEYLEDQYPAKALWPRDTKTRALARRQAREADAYVYPPLFRIARQAFFTKPEERDTADVTAAAKEVGEELGFVERSLQGDFLAGELSAADYTLYPFVALLGRIEQKVFTDLGVMRQLGPRTQAWCKHIEALPYFSKTIPPHWK